MMACETTLANQFDQAEEYAYHSSTRNASSFYVTEDGHEMIQLCVPKKGDKVLDLGCGTGYFSKVLADVVGPTGKVVAIDPDSERLNLARKNHCVENVEYIEGSAEDIPGNDYDLIFSNYMLHWCKDKEKVFEQAYKSLKPGGTFAFVCVTTDMNIHFTPKEMFSPEFSDDFLSKMVTPSFNACRAYATAHKFRILFEMERSRDRVHQDVQDLIKFYMLHSHGRYDETHFNSEVMEQHYGSSNIRLNDTFAYFILCKD